MLALLGLVLAASNPASALATTLESSLPWWERIAITVDGKGTQQSCTFQSSLEPTGPKICEQSLAKSMQVTGTGGPQGTYSKITFERRFSPVAQLDSGKLEPGDTLLARQVLFLTIGADGSIDGCKVIATGGDMALAYGCEEAEAEQFRAVADQGQSPAARQAFLTILAYCHEEQIA